MAGLEREAWSHLYDDDVLCCSWIRRPKELGTPHARVEKGPIGWMDGEVYGERSLTPNPLNQLLACRDVECLRAQLCQLEGIFTVVIYHPSQKKIFLATDRLGLCPLFLWEGAHGLCWSSEIKGLFGFDGFSRQPDQRTLQCFMKLGHLVGDDTPFRAVKMLPPATIFVWDAAAGAASSQIRYWRWSEIKPLGLGVDEAIEALREAWRGAVLRRANRQTVLALSGGLDSRLILAELAREPRRPRSFTIGQLLSSEIFLAKRVCRAAGAANRSLLLSRQNWFEGRPEFVWKTDGMGNLRHFHYGPFLARLKRFGEVSLNGFAGDAVLGQTFLKDGLADRRITEAAARGAYGDFATSDDPSRSFYDIDHSQPYFFNNRVRRFTNLGELAIGNSLTSRKPFMDYGVLRIAFGLPDLLRNHNRLFSSFALRSYPELFASIPWEKTGRPLGGRPEWLSALRARALELLRQKTPDFFTHQVHPRLPLADYRGWLTSEPHLSRFMALLNPQSSRAAAALGTDYSRHLAFTRDGRRDYTELVCRALSLEIWLRQLEAQDPTAWRRGLDC